MDTLFKTIDRWQCSDAVTNDFLETEATLTAMTGGHRDRVVQQTDENVHDTWLVYESVHKYFYRDNLELFLAG